MLVIRTPQMRVFELAQWDALAWRLGQHLRDALPADYARMGEPAVAALARRAITLGKERGMVSELDFFRLFNLMFLMGEEFERAAWVNEILADRAAPPTTRLRLLEKECRQRGRWG